MKVKNKGIKRHIIVDTMRLLLVIVVHVSITWQLISLNRLSTSQEKV